MPDNSTNSPSTAMWLDRYPMTDSAHQADLEQRASIHEFGSKLPRHLAEERAHQDYRREQLVEAAAHHFLGMKAAHATNHADEAQKHGAMYITALRALGHTNSIYPPDEVAQKAKHLPAGIYNFKAHPADALSVRVHKGDDKPLAKTEGKVDLEPGATSSGDVESRRYGKGGRIQSGPHAGKKNPYFRYDDYLPDALKQNPDRPNGITIHQRGKHVIAELNGGHGSIQAFRHGDGGYVITHDNIKNAHPIVQQYRQHVVRALGDHLKAAHGAPYFVN